VKKRLLLLLLILVLILPSVVFAAGTYHADITVSDNTSSDRVGVPSLIPFGTTQAVVFGYIDADGMDTRMFEGTGEVPYMVADDRVGILSETLLADQERGYRLETGYSPVNDAFGIIPGGGGYVTTPDAAMLEQADNFTIEQSGWIDTTSINNWLVRKLYAFRTYISASGNITSSIMGGTTWVTPTSCTDPGSIWANEAKAYNDNDADYAETTTIVGAGAWQTNFIEFGLGSAIDLISVRYKGNTNANDKWTQIDIDYSTDNGSSWDDGYQGACTPGVLESQAISAEGVNRIRLKGYNSDGIARNLFLYEVDFGQNTAQATVSAPGISSGNMTVTTGIVRR